ncbi:hypothetical protein BJ546DRAFT_963670, partial [Cryomyces antarcticus]
MDLEGKSLGAITAVEVLVIDECSIPFHCLCYYALLLPYSSVLTPFCSFYGLARSLRYLFSCSFSFFASSLLFRYVTRHNMRNFPLCYFTDSLSSYY